ncbi:reverse transcriptase [Caerostris darwini]|uniref:Reverse transcriptase n=1 Tax=Caerostris darwini TaxID=1538125 RepID=A0AAV4T0W7_9ARAC|nr:reverse transcriptase [Caerostris darwini]
MSSKGVTWKFIPERAPWWGGFWERLMKSIKDPLRKILGKALLTFEELTTIMTELECVLNNRPITYETNELDEPRCLTPSQFLLPGRDILICSAHEATFDSQHRRNTKGFLT